MILAQFNSIGFHEDILARVDVDNIDYLVGFETDIIPMIMLIVDASTTATINLLDNNDNVVGTALNMTVQDMTTYKRLFYAGTELSIDECGIYSLKITNGDETYYSDKFRWLDDVTQEIYINAVSSDIRLGKNYVLNLTASSFEFDCYLSGKYLGISPEIEDDVSEQIGIQRVNYANLIGTKDFTIHGTENTFRFLAGLRILEVNGVVTVGYNYKTYTANDILVEKQSDMIDVFDISFKFTVINDVLSAIN